MVVASTLCFAAALLLAGQSLEPRAPVDPLVLELSPVWVVFGPDDGRPVVQAGRGIGGALRIYTMRRDNLVIVPVVLGLGVAPGEVKQFDAIYYIWIAPELGWSFDWGADGAHSVVPSLGVGFGAAAGLREYRSVGGWGLTFTPSVRYRYQVIPNLFLGGGLRLLAPVTNPSDREGLATVLTSFLDIGWSLSD